ncbi:Molybdopterin synthase sulfur carrier subunit [Paraliobacillus sp. PM-2]|uniref:molybdopterin converting factor subunit 1 n=1 Tax=Paraliobacillus sp. PM-2 TaxID=1462524 RepID=UPI00061C8E2E|nr:molybdopterin converting factor subunit 1 [Paraliobacillus sp. PM-2]CQR46566.1 Molybdopterin synthase sulfur carrier subunit [Paraliobacillus sp. PM-2]
MKVLLFAHLQEQLGVSELELNWESQTVESFKKSFQHTYPIAQLDNVMVAINEAFALEQDLIQKDDTVAFIPPVSGG